MDGSVNLERVCVLFIGTQFSILYTSMYSPAEAVTLMCAWLRRGSSVRPLPAGGYFTSC